MSTEISVITIPSHGGNSLSHQVSLLKSTSEKIRWVVEKRDRGGTGRGLSISTIADCTDNSRTIVNAWYKCKNAGPIGMEAIDAGWVQPQEFYRVNKNAGLSWAEIDTCLSWIKNNHGKFSRSAFLRWEKIGYKIDKTGKPILATFEKLTIPSLVLGLRKSKDIRCHVLASGIDSGDWEKIKRVFSEIVTPEVLIGSERSEFDAAQKRR